MQRDPIEEIGIDTTGAIYVRPQTSRFPMMYREAMEVRWDSARLCLFSPTDLRNWSYKRWFQQLMAGAKEQGVQLEITPATVWVNIPTDLRREIEIGS